MNISFKEVSNLVITYASKIILSIIVLIIGLYLVKKLTKNLKHRFKKAGLEESLQSFLTSLIKVTLQILLGISILSMLGVKMASFIAILGAIGLAVGMSLQGSLSNFAGGVIILFFKPFKIGDTIEVNGYSGVVEDIQIFYTILNTFNNEKVIIPNSEITDSGIKNNTANSTRRLNLSFGVGYNDDISHVKKVLKKIADNHELILETPVPQAVVSEHGASSVNINLKAWCKTEDYWSIYFELLESVKLEFDNEGINIPYPQRDVHLIGEK